MQSVKISRFVINGFFPALLSTGRRIALNSLLNFLSQIPTVEFQGEKIDKNDEDGSHDKLFQLFPVSNSRVLFMDDIWWGKKDLFKQLEVLTRKRRQKK